MDNSPSSASSYAFLSAAEIGGIGAASKQGVLVKGSNYLEALSEMKTIVFDKTGTLTKGEFVVSEVIPNGWEKEGLLEVAALAEGYSDHPISAARYTTVPGTVHGSYSTPFSSISFAFPA